MKMLIPVLLMALMVSTVQADAPKKKEKSTLAKIWEYIVPPKPVKKQKKHVVRKRSKPTSIVSVTPTPAMRGKAGTYVVDAQWMADYWEQELAWGYWIPEDDEVKFIEGKYYVPPVVYRHFEDMRATVKTEQRRYPFLDRPDRLSDTPALARRGGDSTDRERLYLSLSFNSWADRRSSPTRWQNHGGKQYYRYVLSEAY